MDRTRKLELIQRSLGIRHKLKVHDSMKAPDTHEELAIMLNSRWELEDELRAIEEILADVRHATVGQKRAVFERGESVTSLDREARKRMSES
jgi:hypothetical protein